MAVRGEAAGLRSPRAQIAVVVLGAAALAILYWQFVYSPLTDEEARFASSFKKLEKENQTLGEEERIQNDMLKCKPELDALNRENELMLPSEAEPVAFLKNLSSMAATAGLEQGPTKMMPEADVQAPPQAAEEKRLAEEKKASDAAAKAGGADAVPCWEKLPGLEAEAAARATFVRVAFVLEVRGTFHQLMRYFWMIHEHANAGRIITVEDLGLTRPVSGADGIVMTARFTAVGFREPDGAAAAGDVSVAPKGGKGQVRAATARRERQVEAAAASGGAAAPAAPVETAPAPVGQAAGPGGQVAAPPAGAAPATGVSAEPADKARTGIDRVTRPEAQ
jgi:Tfp pilus assembly protein PilO